MDEALKRKYQQCKLKVKVWEDEFMTNHGSIPSKEDIKKAESSVRHAYKFYHKLKAELSKKSENIGDVLKNDNNITEKAESLKLSNTNGSKIIDTPDFVIKTSTDLQIHDKCAIKDTQDLKHPISDSNKLSEHKTRKQIEKSVESQTDSVLKSVNNSLEAIFSVSSVAKSAPTKAKKDIIPVYNNGGHLKELNSRLCILQNQTSSSTESNKELGSSIPESPKEAEVISDINTADNEPSDFPDNVKNVWGSHLNKANQKTTAVKKLRERTSSFHFTQKLFSTSNFKTKRNPLKPHVALRRTKSECFSLFNESSSDNQQTLDTSTQSLTLATVLSQKNETDKDLPAISVEKPATLQLFSNTKCKVVVKDSTQSKASFQTSSRLTSESHHSLNEDWLNRCTQPSESPIVDIFAKEKFVSRNANIPKPAVPKFPPKEKNEEVCEPNIEIQNNVSLLQPEIESSQNCSVSASYEINTDIGEHINSDVDLFADEENDIVSDSDTEQKQESFLLATVTKRSAIETLSPLKPARKKAKVEKAPKEKSSQQVILEKKISDGRINENFVKINIKKKVFVRGRKNTSYSKYKKMMYKKKQTGSGPGNSKSKGSCFSCGETGHWANNCPQKTGLMPLEEAEQVDDSPYLTLEEAGALADENKPASRFAPMPQPVSENSSKESESNSEDIITTSNAIYNLPPRNMVQPVYPRPDDGNTVIDTPLEVLLALKQFGHKSFRPGQEEAIMRILSGMSTLVMLSTGAGKSLCYQLPAYLYAKRNQDCITLVVSPLVSLMEDQVGNLPGPLEGACLHMNQTPKQREQIEEQLKQGKLHVLLVSPEAVVNSDRQGGLGGLLRYLPAIAFACIDEAHCVSQWSHNFRPSYLMLCKVLRERLKVQTVLGLTATATVPTALSIVKHLRVPDDRIISDMPMPENLILSISRDSQRDTALIKLLQGPRFSACESIIIYCIRREECERVAAFIRTSLQDPTKRESAKKRALSWNAEAYHAGLTAFRRKQVQQSFMLGKVRIVVATVAFGMGINKNDLRAVIHYNMPASFERFVQEVGRAGRDGLPAHCHLFLDSKGQDLNELRRHIYSDSIDRHVIRKLLLKVFKPCNCLYAVEALEKWDPVDSQKEPNNEETSTVESPKKYAQVVCTGHEVAFLTDETVQALDLPEENILTLLCYLELHPKKWVELLSSAYILCKVTSYGGPGALKAAAKQCPPLAMAVALDQKAGISHDKSTSIEFKVIDVASAIGWDSGQVKKQLKDLEWQKVGGKFRRSKLVVNLSGPGLRVRAKGCLPPEDLDEALDWLAGRVEWQERSKLLQLEALFLALTCVSYSSCDECIEEVDLERCEKLKASVQQYFSAEENKDEKPKLLPGVTNEDQVRADVCSMFGTYSDTSFTGRAIARIFHGISSPSYPSYVWGRTRFWRLHLNDNFNTLCRIATTEILRLRS